MQMDKKSMQNWAIIGLGFISQRHIDAIKDIGDNLLMACDIDSQKQLKLNDEVRFFTDWRQMTEDPEFKEKVDYVAICTPNNLHFEMAVNLGFTKTVLCEKPLVISKNQVKAMTLSRVPDNKIFTVLQLRHNPEMQAVKQEVERSIAVGGFYEGSMNINLHRGDFYFKGWKANDEESGGLLFNIGIHYFDLLVWLFGKANKVEVFNQSNEKTKNGKIDFENASIAWHLSIEAPMDNQMRRLKLNEMSIDLTRHFENLHTKVYQDIKNGKGVGLAEASKSIELVDMLKKYERTHSR